MFLELFGIDLNKSVAQLQCEDPLTSKLLREPSADYDTRRPEMEERAGWVLSYPKVFPYRQIRVLKAPLQRGRLASIPVECDLPFVIGYTAYAEAGIFAALGL